MFNKYLSHRELQIFIFMYTKFVNKQVNTYNKR